MISTSNWRLGPFSEILPGPMILNLSLDGELIHHASVERGFLHRGAEKSFEVRRWEAASIVADRIDPECAPAYELAVVTAIEEIAGLQPTKKAAAARRVVCELSRVSSHLLAMVKMAQAVGSETIPHYLLRDRERVLELFELLVGSRFGFNFIRVGGVASDLSDGFCERTIQVCELFSERLKEYDDILSYNSIFIARAKGLGVLTTVQARRFGITGPNARAPGGAYERFLQRLREIHESIAIVRSTLADAMSGHTEVREPIKEIQAGESYVRVEGPRGTIGCYVVSDGSEFPARVQFTVPSMRAISVVPTLLKGARLEDLRLLLASLDISVSEADR